MGMGMGMGTGMGLRQAPRSQSMSQYVSSRRLLCHHSWSTYDLFPQALLQKTKTPTPSPSPSIHHLITSSIQPTLTFVGGAEKCDTWMKMADGGDGDGDGQMASGRGHGDGSRQDVEIVEMEAPYGDGPPSPDVRIRFGEVSQEISPHCKGCGDWRLLSTTSYFDERIRHVSWFSSLISPRGQSAASSSGPYP